MAGMCSPKIGEPSLATVGYEHKLWGKNISKRLASVNCKQSTPQMVFILLRASPTSSILEEDIL